MDVGRLKELMEWMARSDLTELQLTENGATIRLERSAVTGSIEPAGLTAPAANADMDSIVAAPMSGTFYAAAAPGEPPLVRIGDRIAAGQQLCVIEAMKVMNIVVAERAGTIRAIHAESGNDVEAGQPLFTLDA